MAKFHINPAGNATRCQAQQQCPFGDLEKDHYGSADEARAAYEQRQEKPKRQYVNYNTQDSRYIAETIQKQIGSGTLMTLGARELMVIPGGLRFSASILPFNQDGTRSSKAAKMAVEVRLNPSDYYDVHVYRIRGFDTETHYEAEDIDAFSLSKTLYSLDYDGPTAANPRF